MGTYGTIWDRVGSYGTVWALMGPALIRCPYGPISAHTVPMRSHTVFSSTPSAECTVHDNQFIEVIIIKSDCDIKN